MTVHCCSCSISVTTGFGSADPTIRTPCACSTSSRSSAARSGELNKAHTEMRTVYRRRRRILGDRHPDTLKSRQDLAVLRGELNDPEGAVFDLIKLLQDRLRIQGMRSIETFRTRRQLAEWIARAGHPETGLAELRYLQADFARFVEDGHPELAHVAAAIAELS